jgi:OFA family oxalate/formate antiporter-like MFS transporter
VSTASGAAEPNLDVVRWYKLAACILAMLAIANLQYAWTLFTTPLGTTLRASLAAVQVAFTCFGASQTWLLPFNAYLTERLGPRTVVSAAAVLVAVGWVGSGLATNLGTLYFCYGIGGVGAGAVYGACIGLAIRWFPDRRGICVGSVAGAYGFGTALTVIPVAHMIETSGYAHAFIVWGIIQGAVVGLAAQFLSVPPATWAPAGWEALKKKIQTRVQLTSRDYTSREMLRAGSFYVMYVMMTVVAASGLMVTAQLNPMATDYHFDKLVLIGGVTVLNLTLLIDGVLNGATRPLVGWISDRLGRYDTMFLAFTAEALAVFGLTFVAGRPILFMAMSGLVFFAWGEIYSVFPAAIADVFGATHSSTNYGLLYTSKGVATFLAGPLAALLKERTHSWVPVLWIAVGLNLLAALLAVCWLKPMVKRLVAKPPDQAPEAAGEPTAESVKAGLV